MSGDLPPSTDEPATAEQLLRLADEYHEAAKTLAGLGRRGDPLSRAPFRLAAIHAIELYLSALLRHEGCSPSEIRRMQHDLAQRMELATGRGLALRDKTAKHIADLTDNREYLVSRYGPQMTAKASQVNRITATLNEVAAKVTAKMQASV